MDFMTKRRLRFISHTPSFISIILPIGQCITQLSSYHTAGHLYHFPHLYVQCCCHSISVLLCCAFVLCIPPCTVLLSPTHALSCCDFLLFGHLPSLSHPSHFPHIILLAHYSTLHNRLTALYIPNPRCFPSYRTTLALLIFHSRSKPDVRIRTFGSIRCTIPVYQFSI